MHLLFVLARIFSIEYLNDVSIPTTPKRFLIYPEIAFITILTKTHFYLQTLKECI